MLEEIKNKMETISSLDDLFHLEPQNWYSFLPSTSCSPTARTGHSIVQHPSANILYCIGGANNEGLSQKNYVLDLNEMKWKDLCASGFEPRYEHSVFALKNKEQLCVYVFGGANTSGNKNDIQVYTDDCQLWETLNVIGQKPSERTQHSCAVSEKLHVVFGGGKIGTEPILERSVYTFNPVSKEWSLIQMSGEGPCSRQGHSMTAIGSKVYVFGGMNGDTIFDDLYVMDIEMKQWSLLNPSGSKPSARAAHSTVLVGNKLYLFGGLGRDGALNDLYCFKPGSTQWTKVISKTEAPPPRLNFAMCVINLHLDSSQNYQENILGDKRTVETNDETNMKRASSSQSANHITSVIMIHGGVNSSCCIFDDSYFFLL